LLTAIFLMEHPAVAAAKASAKTTRLGQCRFEVFGTRVAARGFNSLPPHETLSDYLSRLARNLINPRGGTDASSVQQAQRAQVFAES
jgi:hypothetical protein